MTPPAVAPTAPASASQSAAPPGSGSPSGAPPSGGLFGEILDSARTAVAEGQKGTGTKAGDQNSNAKSSTSGGKPSADGKPSSDAQQATQEPDGAQLIAAALAVLTDQRPSDQGHTAKGSAGDDASATAAGTDGAAATGGTGSAPASTAADADASDTKTDAAADQAATTAAPPQPAATATDAKRLAPAADGRPGDAESGVKADQPATATAPATAGQYTQQAAASAAGTSTNTTTEVTASHVSSTPQSADPKPAARADDVAKLPATAAAAASSQPAMTASPPQAQGTAPGAASPTLEQQREASGNGAHSGNGSGGRPGTPGQSSAGNPAAGTTGATSTSQSPSPFTIGAATGSQTTGAAQSAPAGAHEIVRTAVSLQDAVDAVRASFTAANQAGVSTARITLSPESLGGIKISLAQTPDGLIARVATDHPETAMTLQQSAGDLKRSLEDSGMALLRLDIGSSGQQNQGSFAGSTGDGSQTGSGWSGGSEVRSVEEETTPTPTELTSELSSGSLVNVLA
jgi:flagellar hook-length control protein FliK